MVQELRVQRVSLGLCAGGWDCACVVSLGGSPCGFMLQQGEGLCSYASVV